MAKSKIYEIYSELKGSEPLIHRTFLISETATMTKLAYTMMIAFKMQASHLFCFEIPVKKKLENNDEFLRVEIINEFTEKYDDIEIIDAVENRVKDIFSEVGETGTLNYDFGDDWNVQFTVTKIYKDENQDARELPKVTNGTGYGILEDIGGVYMLNEITETYKTKTGETYEEYSEYLGKRFNFTKFDKSKLNSRLKNL
ncbi:MAG: plasmid pRiA4b ORF-3 family protein [Clostridia bacterium]